MDYHKEYASLIESEKRELLGIYRDCSDTGDKWASAMEFAFGVAANVYDRGGDIPRSLNYKQSILGPDDGNSYYDILDGYEILTLEVVLQLVVRILRTLEFREEDY